MIHFFEKIFKYLVAGYFLSILFFSYHTTKAQIANDIDITTNSLYTINSELKLGVYNTDVKKLQTFLNSNGFILATTGPGSIGKETNYFGPLTKQALINFQNSKNLKPTGILDADTREIINNFNSELKLSVYNTDVKKLQRFLNSNGFILATTGPGSIGKETNYFGPLTKQALINFQNSKNLKSTGILDADTREIINSINSNSSSHSNSNTTTKYYSVGGKITGINSSIVLKNNKDKLVVNVGDDGSFTFPTKLLNGDKYNVSMDIDSYYQRCSIKNNSGIIKGVNIENIIINCNKIYHDGRGGGSSSSNTYNLNYSASSNGSISGLITQTINQSENGSQVIAIPNTGYHFTNWSDGVLTAERTDTNISGNISVSASFAINTYEINASAGSNGSITPAGTTTKEYNSNQNYQIEANEGFQIDDVIVDGTSFGSIDLYEFSYIQDNHTISVSFKPIPVSTITVSAISPSSGYDTKSVSIESIIGTGFRIGVSVKLTKNGENDINCTNVVFESNTSISNAYCDISLVKSGNWNVVIENSDSGSGMLTNGFDVNEYEIGSVGPLSGYIFYVNDNRATDGWKYMETASGDLGGSGIKRADNTGSMMGATGVAIGKGLPNTEQVTGSTNPINTAIEYSLNHSVNGIDDWFLPSEDELNLMYANLHLAGKGGFSESSYWSSTEVDSTNAKRKSFNSGLTSNGGKGSSYRIRPVRRFSTCKNYTITYDGNENTEGSVPTDTASYLMNSTVTVLDKNTLARDDYYFTGWNTSPNGNGTDYATGSTLTMPANGITLYAKWYQPNFTIAIVPDTQSYVNRKKAEMTDQIDWLVSNKNNLNLKFVSHVGDIVQNWDGVPSDWEFVQTEMAKLKNNSIPYTILPGNHDYAYMSRNSLVFNNYFPLSNYSNMDSYGGSYDTNSDNQYHILSVDKDNNGVFDDRILIISLEFGPREAIINWANNILAANSGTTAIIVTHAYLQPDGDLLENGDNHAASNGYGLGSDVYDGDELWDSLVRPNSNVRFVFCGHDGESDDGSAIRTSTRTDGSSVYQVLTNYQYYPINEAGYLTLLNFTNNKVTMKTFSPWTNIYKTDVESQATRNWVPFDFN